MDALKYMPWLWLAGAGLDCQWLLVYIDKMALLSRSFLHMLTDYNDPTIQTDPCNLGNGNHHMGRGACNAQSTGLVPQFFPR